MKIALSTTLAIATLAFAAQPALPAAEDPGYVDFGQISAAPNSRFVEVNVSTGLLKFAAKIAAAHEPDAAELLKNIKHVRVNVVGLDDTNRTATAERITAIRADLEKKGWEKIVTAHEPKKSGSEDIGVYMKTNDDTVLGVVVTVLASKGEAVFVNVVGNIRAEDLARLGEKLDIKPLSKLKLQRKDANPS